MQSPGQREVQDRVEQVPEQDARCRARQCPPAPPPPRIVPISAAQATSTPLDASPLVMGLHMIRVVRPSSPASEIRLGWDGGGVTVYPCIPRKTRGFALPSLEIA